MTQESRHKIFVFGSNLMGIHGAGSALEARRRWGARSGCGVGPQGHSYAIPTKGRDLSVRLPLWIIQRHVSNFIEYAAKNDQQDFDVVAIGCGLAGYKPKQIAPMFYPAFTELANVHLKPEFIEVLEAIRKL